eukprot:764817-Hanusia_phi.AAC.4
MARRKGFIEVREEVKGQGGQRAVGGDGNEGREELERGCSSCGRRHDRAETGRGGRGREVEEGKGSEGNDVFKVAGSGWRKQRRGAPLANTYRNWCDARAVPVISLYKDKTGYDEVEVLGVGAGTEEEIDEGEG